MHQPNEGGTTAAVYLFPHEVVAIATDKSQYVELGPTTLSHCSGTNRNNFCCKGFSTTTDETLLCLTSQFSWYSNPAPCNCLVDYVLLSEAPQASYLADCLYNVLSRTAYLQVKNDTGGLPYACPASSVKPVVFDLAVCQQSPSTKAILFLPPTWTFVKPNPSLSLHLSNSTFFAAIFNTVPSASADLNVYSFGEARREIASSVHFELAALPHVKTMTRGDLRTVAQPISHYYTIISPSIICA